MTPINHYEGDRPKIENHTENDKYKWDVIEQVNWPDGVTAFYGWDNTHDISHCASSNRTVAIFHITYKSK